MFCKYCGKKIDSNSEYCPFCGRELADDLNDEEKEAKKLEELE